MSKVIGLPIFKTAQFSVRASFRVNARGIRTFEAYVLVGRDETVLASFVRAAKAREAMFAAQGNFDRQPDNHSLGTSQ
jgi:hypothetical protein